ncbi:MAG: hypothetical protein GX605_11345 [Chloroflexi bacterium]|nr:hypothetical protein [Chloroflexota bacterium]
MILRLLYVGFAVENVDQSRRRFRDLFGMWSEKMGPDPYLGTDNGAILPFPNDCWVYFMESSRPDSRIHKFIAKRGAGLERVAFLTDDIEADLARARKAGLDLGPKDLVDTPLGRRFTVGGEHVSGVTVEMWESDHPVWDHCRVPADISGVLGLQHIGVAVEDLDKTVDQFRRYLGLEPGELRTDQHYGEQKDIMIEPGNDRLWLHVTQSWGPNARVRHFMETKGQGLEHLCVEVDDIRTAVKRVRATGLPFHEHKIFTDRPDGFEAFVYPEHSLGVTVELIEPYPTSRGYRERR